MYTPTPVIQKEREVVVVVSDPTQVRMTGAKPFISSRNDFMTLSVVIW